LAKRKDEVEFFRYYWVTGDPVPSTARALPDGLTDTPFQILKAYELFKFLDRLIQNERIAPTTKNQPTGASTTTTEGLTDETSQANQLTAEVLQDELTEGTEKEKAEIRKFLDQSNGDIAMKWVEVLDKTNKRDSFVWPHSNRGGMNYFRLDDHVWIWNTIKAISDILVWEEAVKNSRKKIRKISRPEVDADEWSHRWIDIMRKYMPAKVKREIIQCFTTVYDVSNERMLAVTRSPRETRFEFHSRDTALFYHIVDGELMLGEDEERWSNLIQIQKRFPSTQDTESDNPLRHGLGMLLTRGVYRQSSIARKMFEDHHTCSKRACSQTVFFQDRLQAMGKQNAAYIIMITCYTFLLRYPIFFTPPSQNRWHRGEFR
jgi:hypothetical protein